MLEMRNNQPTCSGESSVTEDDKVVLQFIQRNPNTTVVHGPLYRVVDAQLMKGLYINAYVQMNYKGEMLSWESAAETLSRALGKVEEQISAHFNALVGDDPAALVNERFQGQEETL
jgi:translation initiation factor 6 (eIF-6)